MFISQSVLEWEPLVESWEGINDEWEVPYSYYRHAEKLLENDQKHFLIDSVSNLKRAVDHRIKQITATYKIKKIPCFAETKSVLETLARLEVVKPLMLGQLLEIRNAVEHKFSEPPPLGRCKELAEFAWYFLRSTDPMAKQVSDGPYLSESYDGTYHAGFDAHPRNDWQRTLSVHLPQHLVSNAPTPGYFEIAPIEVTTGAELKLQEQGKDAFHRELASRYRDDDAIVVGTMCSPELELWFFRLYFRIN